MRHHFFFAVFHYLAINVINTILSLHSKILTNTDHSFVTKNRQCAQLNLGNVFAIRMQYLELTDFLFVTVLLYLSNDST